MKINSVIVIGAGTMGQGIAQWFLQQNVAVEMVDNNFEFALKSREKIIEQLNISQSEISRFFLRISVLLTLKDSE